MPLGRETLIARALNSLSAVERAQSIVYIDDQPLAVGTAQLGKVQVNVPWPALVFFIDLQPGANWGHLCRYYLINPDTGESLQIPAQFPPFLKGVPPTLQAVWVGNEAPRWAVAVPD